MVNYTNLTCSNCKKKSLSSFFASTLNDANKELTKEVNRWRATCKVINKVTNQNELVEDANTDKPAIADLGEADRATDRIHRNFVTMSRPGDNVVL